MDAGHANPQPAGGLRIGGASTFLRRDLSDAALRQPVAPTFGADELRAAREHSYDLGHAAGLAEAEAARAAFETMTLAAIAGAMASARTEIMAVAEDAATALARAVIAAMAASMPALVERSAVDEISALIDRLLPGLAREPNIRVLVAPDIAEAVGARLELLDPEDRARMTVAGQDGLAVGAARLVWSAGYAERRPDQVWRRIMDAFNAQLETPVSKDTPDGQ
jgi:flagellar biosynthesis/type III secretory pathway protein FliH